MSDEDEIPAFAKMVKKPNQPELMLIKKERGKSNLNQTNS